MTWLPISTLSYYSQIELLPNLKRQQTGGLDKRHLEVPCIIKRLIETGKPTRYGNAFLGFVLKSDNFSEFRDIA